MIRILICTIAVLLTTSLIAADNQQREMWQEPSHQLVFERGDMRILDIRIVPGVTSEFHSHHLATVYFIVQDALMQNQDDGEEWSARSDRQMRPAGALADRADYVVTNTYHRVKNYDEHAFHLLSVVNSSLPAPLGQAQTANENNLLNNPWFAEHRLSISPRSAGHELSFDNDVVLTQAHEGAAHVLEDGVVHSARSMPGAWSVHTAGSRFRIVNESSETHEFTLIEVRKPPN